MVFFDLLAVKISLFWYISVKSPKKVHFRRLQKSEMPVRDESKGWSLRRDHFDGQKVHKNDPLNRSSKGVFYDLPLNLGCCFFVNPLYPRNLKGCFYGPVGRKMFKKRSFKSQQVMRFSVKMFSDLCHDFGFFFSKTPFPAAILLLAFLDLSAVKIWSIWHFWDKSPKKVDLHLLRGFIQKKKSVVGTLKKKLIFFVFFCF